MFGRRGEQERSSVEVAHDGVVRETDAAKLFKFAEGNIWIPKSQIKGEEDNTVTLPEWLAVEKGLV